ncbi:alpha-amylase family glycosyl hydrolase [Shewanella livingstonensis]|uniref:Alpha-amylase n=1 Tax=Shewanella livingstonensis TaxID=150120 RepID=A0A3G8LRZ2_9GAMM|nr:alpha-amylase family glycosyl hydrolase [Shewanella livingstonensis]AZG72319.1 alpha-amylase [Shewanella livingstonensis]
MNKTTWALLSAVWVLSGCQQAEPEVVASAVQPLQQPTDKTDIYNDYLHRDVRDDIFYFVLPDRFYNGDSSNDNGSTTESISQGGVDLTSPRGFHGGDIKGIEQKLDYLQNLGITAIWMTPLLRNKAIQSDGIAHHGYWIVDFTEVDPHFGTNDDLKLLIESAHQRGMKVFFDIITNHTADVIKYQECHQASGEFIAPNTQCAYKSLAQVEKGDSYTPFVPQNQASVKVPEWLNDPRFYHNQGDSTFKGESSLNGDFNGLDDLNTADPEVVSGMVDIYQHLIKEFKPDGFRIDTVKHVDLSFWQTFSPEIVNFAKAQGIPQFHVFGEVYDTNPNNLSVYTTKGNLPSVLDFAFQQTAADIFYRGKSPVLAQQLFAQDTLYQDEDSQADLLMTFLGNHDMGRTGYFINQAQANMPAEDKLQRSILSHAFMFLSRGIPVIYYGDEQGFTGDGNDIGAREDMFSSKVASYNDNVLLGSNVTTAADNFDVKHPLYQAIAQLSELRKQYPILRRGQYQDRFYQADKDMFAFARVDPETGAEFLMVFNSGEQAQTINVTQEGKRYRLMTTWPDVVVPSSEDAIEAASVELMVTLPRLSYAIYTTAS